MVNNYVRTNQSVGNLLFDAHLFISSTMYLEVLLNHIT